MARTAKAGSAPRTTPSKLDPHDKDIRERIANGESCVSIAESYDVHESAVRRWVRKNGIVKPAPSAIPKKLVLPQDDPESELEILRAQLKEARAVIGRQRRVSTVEARVAQEIRQAVAEVADVKFDIPTAKDTKKLVNPHAHVAVVSDLHAFEVVDPVAVNGLNEYNWDIAQERMWRMRDSILSFKKNRPFDFDELQIWILGDMLSGNIHEELRATNEKPIAVQAVTAGLFLAKWCETFMEVYPKVKIMGISGNHPRTGKDHSAKQVYDNFDWVAYKYIEVYLQKYIEAGFVEIDFPESGSIIADIVGRNYLLTHGDGTRTNMPGVPWGGVMRKFNSLRNEYARPDHGREPIFLHGMALGHFHESNIVKGGMILMNGSIKGADEWALKQFGSSEPPTQILATFNRAKSRITDTSFLTP